jgi:hypothetical protein
MIKAEQQHKKLRPRWLKILLSTLRFLLVPTLCLVALTVGLVGGYVYLGGQPISEVWTLTTWKHLVDLVFDDS